jgi:hypothetical protein
MTDLQIRVDAGETISFLGTARRQLSFAVSVALNKTAKDVQQAERSSLETNFIIRKPWVTQGITIPKFSDKSELAPTVVIALDDTRGFLAKFEDGGVKTALDPTRPIAVPSLAVRPTKQDLPLRSLYPTALGLVTRHGVTGLIAPRGKVSRRGVLQLQGKRRTFVLSEDMYGVQVPGVYQRFGPGKHDFRLLWAYKRSIPIPALLHFAETGLKTVAEVWATNFATAFERAMATAR